MSLPPHPEELPRDADANEMSFLARRFAAMPAWAGYTLLVAAAAVTLLVSALVAKRTWAIGIPGEWQWSFREVPVPFLLVMPSLAMLLLLAGLTGLILRRGIRNRREEILTVGIALVLSLGAILEIGGASPIGRFSAYDSIVAPWAGGYYGEAARVENMPEYLDNYDELIASLRVNDLVRGHIADHPAGPVLFHWIINRRLEAFPSVGRRLVPEGTDQPLYEGTTVTPRLIAEQMAKTRLTDGEFAGIWGSALLFRLGFWLTLPFVYLLTRDLLSKEAALVALALAAVVPALHLFGPYPDQLFPLFFMSTLFCWHRALRRGSSLWAAVASLITFTGLMWSLSMMLIPATLFLWTLLQAYRERAENGTWPFRRWIAPGTAALVVFVVVSLLPSALFGYHTWRVWRICLSQHASFAALFPRTYMAWVLFNPVEFLVFSGLPTALLFMAACVADAAVRRREGKRRSWTPALWALVGILFVLNLSGKNLGETARLWMFFMPLAAVGASVALTGLDRRRGWVAAAMVALGALQLAAFQMNLKVFV